ncbi:MAG: hypothetical protein RL708_971, partial [Bacteroidota bacterium]
IHLQNYLGCDSLVTLNLLVNNPSTKNISASICSGSSYSVGSSSFNATGIYAIHLQNYLGCDSVVTLNLVVGSSFTASVSITSSTPSTICFGTPVIFTASPINGGLQPSYQWLKNSTIVGVNDSIYTDSLLANNDVISCKMVSNGSCVSAVPVNSNTLSFNVNPLPATASAMINSPLCEGGNLVLFTQYLANANYTWSGPNGFTSNAQAIIINNATSLMNGIYSVHSTVNGCSSPTFSVVATVRPIPAKPLVDNTFGNILNSSSATNNQWLYNGNILIGATDSNYVAHQNGYYQVQVSNSYGCTNTSDSLLLANVGIENLEEQDVVKIFPNPFANSFSLECSIAINRYEIIASDGTIIKQSINPEHNTSIDLKDFPSGIYYLRLTKGTQNFTYKLIKQNQ